MNPNATPYKHVKEHKEYWSIRYIKPILKKEEVLNTTVFFMYQNLFQVNLLTIMIF